MIKHNLRLAWRTLAKNKFISTVNIFGLAIGLTAALLMMIWVDSELSYDTHYKDYKKTYIVLSSITALEGKIVTWNRQPYHLAGTAANEIAGIEYAAKLTTIDDTRVLRVGNQSFYATQSAYIDEQWFEIFNQKILSGEVVSFFDNPFSVVLTEERAKLLYGDSNPVGKTMLIDSVQYVIRAVIENNKPNTTFQYNMFLPVQAAFTNPQFRKDSENWKRSSYFTFITVVADADTAAVASAMTALYKRHSVEPDGVRMKLIPLHQLHFDEHAANDLTKGNKQSVMIFSVLAGLILLSACINYVNLTTARASQRSKEVGIRKLVGARKYEIFKQFFIESVLTTAIALALAVVTVQLALPWFNAITGKSFLAPLMQQRFWTIVCATGVLVVITNGIYPSLLLSSFKPLIVLKGNNLFSIKDGYLRKTLVVVQFSFSIALITGTILLSKQLRFITQRDNGFERSGVFQMPIPYAAFDAIPLSKQDAIINRMRDIISQQTSVSAVSVATPGIGNTQVFFTGEADWPGKKAAFDPVISPFWADDHFFKMFNLKLAEGRWLRNHPADAKNVVINESAMHEFGFRKPVTGQSFVYLGDTGVIVGVVKDLQYKSVHEKIGAQVFKQNDSAGTLNLYVKPVVGQTARALAGSEKIWNQYLPSFPFAYTFVEDDYAAMYAAEEKSTRLISILSFLAISISCLGLLTLAMFSVQSRAKEISIRKILGAGAITLLNLLSKDFVKLVVLAALIAFPVAYYFGNKWLENFAYKIDFTWEIFALAGGSALLIAIATIGVLILKAVIANPVKSLRNDQ